MEGTEATVLFLVKSWVVGKNKLTILHNFSFIGILLDLMILFNNLKLMLNMPFFFWVQLSYLNSVSSLEDSCFNSIISLLALFLLST